MVDEQFAGFETPEENWSKLPHTLIESFDKITTMSELKVILYVLRHTWGFQEYGADQLKKITLDEFMHGRKRKDRTRMDNGTGMSKQAVIDGINLATEHGFLVKEQDTSDRARVKNYYRLNMLTAEPESTEGQGSKDQTPDGNLRNSQSKDQTPRVYSLDTSGLDSRHRSVKDTVDRYQKRDTLLPDDDDDALNPSKTAKPEGKDDSANDTPDGLRDETDKHEGVDLQFEHTVVDKLLCDAARDVSSNGKIPTRFQNHKQRDTYHDAAATLGDRLGDAFDLALLSPNPPASLGALVNYVAKIARNGFFGDGDNGNSGELDAVSQQISAALEARSKCVDGLYITIHRTTGHELVLAMIGGKANEVDGIEFVDGEAFARVHGSPMCVSHLIDNDYVPVMEMGTNRVVYGYRLDDTGTKTVRTLIVGAR